MGKSTTMKSIAILVSLVASAPLSCSQKQSHKEPTTTATTITAKYRPFYRAGGGMGWLEMVHHPDFEAKLKMGQEEAIATTTTTTATSTTTVPVELLCE